MVEREAKIIEPDFFRPVQSAQDWEEIEERLSVVHPIRLIIDDYKVSMHQIKLKMKLVIVLFIDGKYEVEKWKKDSPEILEKFYQKKEAYVHGKKFRDHFVKHYGKRKAKSHGVFKKSPYMQYYWTSFRSLRLHLQKTCKKILVNQLDIAKTFGELFLGL